MARDIQDVRTLIERFEELEGELTTAHDAASEDEPDCIDRDNWIEAVAKNPDDSMHEEAVEFLSLESFLDELADRGSGDHQWRGSWYPATLVPEYAFKTYAMDTAEELGLINSDAAWPVNCIDWDQAARELQQDYSQADWDGTTYYYRS